MIYILSFLFSLLSYSQELPDAKGSYNRGSLEFAWELPLEGEGYVRLFSQRNRGWATLPMIEMIEKSAFEINQLYPGKDPLLVGDISAHKGGKISRHSSHQNGLDVDLSYYRLNGSEQSSERQDSFLENMVRGGRLSKNFDVVRNWELVKALFRFGKVTRIFIDKVIKKEFCKHAEILGEKELYQDVLKRLKPYPNHSNHLHVRIQCPENSIGCVNQLDYGSGLGC
jgi:penicillin-insensitive murein endopeptidase